MKNSISILACACLIGVLAILLPPNSAEGARPTSSAGLWPPCAADMVNVDGSAVAPTGKVPFDSNGRHVMLTVPSDRFLVVTNFEAYGFWQGPNNEQFISRFDLLEGGASDVVKHSFCGTGGDLEFHDAFQDTQTGRWSFQPGPFRSSGLGLVFNPGSEVLLVNRDLKRPYLCEYNLVGYWLDG
jgi:hypothetical protein